MSDLEAVKLRLAEYYDKPEDIELWLSAPHPQLNFQYPICLIAEGRVAEVLTVLDRLDSGCYL